MPYKALISLLNSTLLRSLWIRATFMVYFAGPHLARWGATPEL
jgi:hypothetical protein